jgi:hypothetical protein
VLQHEKKSSHFSNARARCWERSEVVNENSVVVEYVVSWFIRIQEDSVVDKRILEED